MAAALGLAAAAGGLALQAVPGGTATGPALVALAALALAVAGLALRALRLADTLGDAAGAMAAGGDAVRLLRRLKELGLRLAVDDFGTGYSSLSYLRSLPIDVLKIDKSFVNGVTLGPEQSAVARAIVKLARTFGLETIAEGVEDDAQRAELAALGAGMGQGFRFSRPLDAAATEAYLAAAGPVALPAVPRPAVRAS